MIGIGVDGVLPTYDAGILGQAADQKTGRLAQADAKLFSLCRSFAFFASLYIHWQE